MKFVNSNKTNSAFTLIELLIVIAILGVLAAVLLILIKPAERLAQTRDAGRISSVTQLGRAIHQYYVVHDETFPNPATWSDDLVGTGDITNFPSGVTYSLNSVTPCTTNSVPTGRETFCYALDNVNDYGAIVFAKLESSVHFLKCNLIGDTYVIHSTADGKTGIICSNTDPSPWEPGSMIYLQ